MKRSKEFRRLQSKMLMRLKNGFKSNIEPSLIEEKMMAYINSSQNGDRDDILANEIEKMLEKMLEKMSEKMSEKMHLKEKRK